MDDRTVDLIFAGSLESLPPVSSKIVRIFTSSTFTGNDNYIDHHQIAIITMISTSLHGRACPWNLLGILVCCLASSLCDNITWNYSRYNDGKKHVDGSMLSQIKRFLQGKTRARISGIFTLNYHEFFLCLANRETMLLQLILYFRIRCSRQAFQAR